MRTGTNNNPRPPVDYLVRTPKQSVLNSADAYGTFPKTPFDVTVPAGKYWIMDGLWLCEYPISDQAARCQLTATFKYTPSGGAEQSCAYFNKWVQYSFDMVGGLVIAGMRLDAGDRLRCTLTQYNFNTGNIGYWINYVASEYIL